MRRFFIAWALVLITAAPLLAAEPKVDTVLEGLRGPCGIAIQPETGHVFLADSGALRVVRVVDGKLEEVVTGFSKVTFGPGDKLEVGPLGLAFLDKQTLVVGGSDSEEQGQVLVFTLPQPGQAAVAVDNAKYSLKMPAADKVVGVFYGTAVTKTGVFATQPGSGGKSLIAKADLSGTKIENFRRFVPAKDASPVAAPTAITISPRGELVVGESGDEDTPGDSSLSFFAARDGQRLASYRTGLNDLVALAYSPQGQLYALDCAWADASQGGLFQLVAFRNGNVHEIKAEKIASLERPTAMAFGSKGELYVTVLGGKLLRIAPGL
jgi:hypothetical protein